MKANKSAMPILDERVKYHSFTRFKAKVRGMQRLEIEAFKHFDSIWQIEREAVLVPFDLWMQIQDALKREEALIYSMDAVSGKEI